MNELVGKLAQSGTEAFEEVFDYLAKKSNRSFIFPIGQDLVSGKILSVLKEKKILNESIDFFTEKCLENPKEKPFDNLEELIRRSLKDPNAYLGALSIIETQRNCNTSSLRAAACCNPRVFKHMIGKIAQENVRKMMSMKGRGPQLELERKEDDMLEKIDEIERQVQLSSRKQGEILKCFAQLAGVLGTLEPEEFITNSESDNGSEKQPQQDDIYGSDYSSSESNESNSSDGDSTGHSENTQESEEENGVENTFREIHGDEAFADEDEGIGIENDKSSLKTGKPSVSIPSLAETVSTSESEESSHCETLSGIDDVEDEDEESIADVATVDKQNKPQSRGLSESENKEEEGKFEKPENSENRGGGTLLKLNVLSTLLTNTKLKVQRAFKMNNKEEPTEKSVLAMDQNPDQSSEKRQDPDQNGENDKHNETGENNQVAESNTRDETETLEEKKKLEKDEKSNPRNLNPDGDQGKEELKKEETEAKNTHSFDELASQNAPVAESESSNKQSSNKDETVGETNLSTNPNGTEKRESDSESSNMESLEESDSESELSAVENTQGKDKLDKALEYLNK